MDEKLKCTQHTEDVWKTNFRQKVKDSNLIAASKTMYVQRSNYNKRLKQCTNFGEGIIYNSYKYIGKILKNTHYYY